MTVLRLIVAAVLVALIAIGLNTARPSGELRDYGSFLESGRAATHGAAPYGVHPLTFHVVLPGFDVWNPNLNPPVSLPAFALFDLVDPQTGFHLWWGISLAAYGLTLVLLWRTYRAQASPLVVLWAAALAGFWDTLALGQIYLPLVLTATGGWLLLRAERPWLAGICIGVVVAVKPNFGVWPLLLLTAGHTRPAVSAAATFALLWTIPLALYGTSVYRAWFELLVSDRGRAAFPTNASLPGLLERLGTGIPAVVVAAAVVAMLVAIVYRRRSDALTVSALGIVGGIAASPIAWVHYTLFLLPIFFAARWRPATLATAAMMVVPVTWILGTLGAPAWQQLTLGSIYSWAMLLMLVLVVHQPIVDDAEAPAAARLDSYRPALRAASR